MAKDNNKIFMESLGFLSQTSRLLNRPLKVGDLIAIILEESIKLSEADLVSLVMLDRGKTPEQIYVMSRDQKQKLDLKPGEFEFANPEDDLAVPVPIDSDDHWNRYFQHHLDMSFKCRLRISLFFRNQWSGYLDFYSGSAPCFQAANLVDFLKALAGSFCFAIDNAELTELAQKKALENKLLIETSQMLASVLELDEVIEAIANSLKRVVDYDGISIYLVKQDDMLDPIFWRGYDDPKCRDILMAKAGEGLVGWSASTGQGAVVDDVGADDRYVCARDNTRSELVVPIKLKEKVIGVFNIESDTPRAYSEHDLSLLSTFAAKSAIAIERASLYRELVMKKQLDQEVSIARSIQKTFLPDKGLELAGFDVAGKNISSHQVGGDYYDFIDIEEGQTGLVIADVSGKGIPAALIMASFRASLIAEIRNNYAIRAIMQKVNRLMTESLDQGNFVTAVYGVLDGRSKIFTFSNAGHNPPILLRNTGEVHELTEGGLALGIDESARYEEMPIGLNQGEILVFYTDGVTEAMDRNGEPFETGRLIELIRKNQGRTAAELVDIIAETVQAYKAPGFILDDLTLMILKVK
jgi:sigma-B regulation protein RsbU (phosphoserine phosphatase)